MAEPQGPTDFQKAANVARYVQIEEISLDEVHARLLVPREVAISTASLLVNVEKSAKFSFSEESKRLATVVSLIGRVIPSGDEAPKDLFVEVACKFSLGYSFNVNGGPDGEERAKYLQAFAEINGTYNAWPYFRELFQSSITRMGLPPVVLPLYKAQE